MLLLYVFVTLLAVSSNGDKLREMNEQLQAHLYKVGLHRQWAIDFLLQYCLLEEISGGGILYIREGIKREDAWRQLKGANDELNQCVDSNEEIDELKRELVYIRKTSKTGRIPSGTFKKYCDLVPQFQSCYCAFFPTMNICLDPVTLYDLINVCRAFTAFTEFICMNDGENIIELYNHGGIECIVRKHKELGNCIKTFLEINAKRIEAYEEIDRMLPDMLFCEYTDCAQLKLLHKCMVNVLRSCPSANPAQFFDSMFTTVMKSLPCPHGNYSDLVEISC